MTLYKTDVDLVKHAAKLLRDNGLDNIPLKLDNLAHRLQERSDDTATLTFDGPAAIDCAKALLVANGYVIHKAKSWRQLIERVRVAEALQCSAEEYRQSTQEWAQTTLHNEIRDLMARCTFLYGMARAKGATVEELVGGWTVTGVNIPIEKTQTIQCHCGIHPYIIHDESVRPMTRFICPDHGLVEPVIGGNRALPGTVSWGTS